MSEPAQEPFNPVIVDPQGRPARKAQSTTCPRCGAGADARIASCGFGEPMAICGRCGRETGERWHG